MRELSWWIKKPLQKATAEDFFCSKRNFEAWNWFWSVETDFGALKKILSSENDFGEFKTILEVWKRFWRLKIGFESDLEGQKRNFNISKFNVRENGVVMGLFGEKKFPRDYLGEFESSKMILRYIEICQETMQEAIFLVR